MDHYSLVSIWVWSGRVESVKANTDEPELSRHLLFCPVPLLKTCGDIPGAFKNVCVWECVFPIFLKKKKSPALHSFGACSCCVSVQETVMEATFLHISAYCQDSMVMRCVTSSLLQAAVCVCADQTPPASLQHLGMLTVSVHLCVSPLFLKIIARSVERRNTQLHALRKTQRKRHKRRDVHACVHIDGCVSLFWGGRRSLIHTAGGHTPTLTPISPTASPLSLSPSFAESRLRYSRSLKAVQSLQKYNSCKTVFVLCDQGLRQTGRLEGQSDRAVLQSVTHTTIQSNGRTGFDGLCAHP